jgi:hypothetical protein
MIRLPSSSHANNSLLFYFHQIVAQLRVKAALADSIRYVVVTDRLASWWVLPLFSGGLVVTVSLQKPFLLFANINKLQPHTHSHKLFLHNMGLMMALVSAILASSSVWMMHQQQQQSSLLYTSASTPFTAQEVMWAMRDGYVDTLLMHWWHHGGF